MTLIGQFRVEIGRAINTLSRRRANTLDAAERAVIEDAIDHLNHRLAGSKRAALLDRANALVVATDLLERAVGAARRGPFDGYLAAIEEHLRSFDQLAAELHKREALAPAGEKGGDIEAAADATTRRAGACRAASRRPAADAAAALHSSPGGRSLPRFVRSGPALPRSSLPRAAAALEPPRAIKDFAALTDEYAAYFAACELRPENSGSLAFYVNRLRRGQPMYEQVSADLGGIPWAFIGIIHGMECGFSFASHLHNGDPLTARTVQVPKGRPLTGAPPFTWRQSAVDALMLKKYHEVSDWSVPHMLYLLEKYNGFGYRMRRLVTPYLWSFSNLFAKGKFVRDGVFDPNAVSKQCGAALMLKAVGAGTAARRTTARRATARRQRKIGR